MSEPSIMALEICRRLHPMSKAERVDYLCEHLAMVASALAMEQGGVIAAEHVYRIGDALVTEVLA